MLPAMDASRTALLHPERLPVFVDAPAELLWRSDARLVARRGCRSGADGRLSRGQDCSNQ